MYEECNRVVNMKCERMRASTVPCRFWCSTVSRESKFECKLEVSRSGHGAFRDRRETCDPSVTVLVDGTGALAYAADSPGRKAAQKHSELGDVLMAKKRYVA